MRSRAAAWLGAVATVPVAEGKGGGIGVFSRCCGSRCHIASRTYRRGAQWRSLAATWAPEPARKLGGEVSPVAWQPPHCGKNAANGRPEERRVGKECVSTGRSRRSPDQ